jgi:hypothetical protein
MRCGYVYSDGGRKAAGFPDNKRSDCVVRAIAIATGIAYAEVYKAIGEGQEAQRSSRRLPRGSRRGWAPDQGVAVRRKWFAEYMTSLGWEFIATMRIGSGCRVHLRADELPSEPIICSVSRHYVAVINGVIHDTGNPDRDGTRCVYGYWIRRNQKGIK